MNRKDFLKKFSIASIPLVFQGIPVYAGGGLTESLMEIFGQVPINSDNVLVIIQLNGGNDGLNTVIPLDKYAELSVARPNIIINQTKVLPLSGNVTTGLHPAMDEMRNLYDNNQLAIIQGVSYPNPSFSHFHAQDIWFNGYGVAGSSDSGWIGRTLENKFPAFPAGYPNETMPDPPAIQIGGVMPLSLQGSTINMGYNVPNPTDLVNIVNASPGDLPNSDYGQELGFLRLMKSQSNVYASNITASYNDQNTLSDQYPTSGNSLATQLKIVARLIGGGLKTPIYIVNHENSFDTHVNQVTAGDTTAGSHAVFLEKLSKAVGAFMNDLTLMGKADKVLGMTHSEFGRRVINNASYGTDHGTAAPIFVFGSKVNPGMFGTSPNLPSNPNSNTQVNTQFDYRQVYAEMMRDWLNVSGSDTEMVLNGNYQNINFIHSDTQNVPGNGTLPIDKITLSIKQTLQNDEISFVAYSNHYYEKFIIQMSVDGTIFHDLKDITQRTNENVKTYISSLAKRNEARIYYRVMGISKQQELAYSNIIVTKNKQKQLISVYPNPVTNGRFNISFIKVPTSNVVVEIFDTKGTKLFYNQYTPNQQIFVQLSTLYDLNQLYLIKVSFDGEEVIEKIFFK